jgi:hypothetical protein
MGEEHSCRTAMCKRKCTICNIHVKLEVTHHKKGGGHGICIACAVQILDMMIHSIFDSGQEIETKPLNLLYHLNLKNTYQKCDVLVVFESCSETWIKNFINIFL